MGAAFAECFFVPLDDDGGWLATSATEGPWAGHLQHGGPPSALLVRALQGLTAAQPARLARVTLEFLGPVPVGQLRVTAGVQREGRSVRLLAAQLSTGGRPALRAHAWQLRTDGAGPTVGAGVDEQVPGPDEGAEGVAGFDFGYGHAMRWRVVAGSAVGPGAATVWARPRVPLVPGEEPSPEQVAALAADSGSGVSWELPWDRWSFVNVDLALSFARQPVGSWVCLDARTTMAGDGTGRCRTVLHDEDGWFGDAVQTLLVAPRRTLHP